MESLARVFVLALFAVLLIQLGNGGWAGVRTWIRAKFVGVGG
jgi:hypothetical protein